MPNIRGWRWGWSKIPDLVLQSRVLGKELLTCRTRGEMTVEPDTLSVVKLSVQKSRQ
jgi:hypothetical protein